MSDPKPDRWQNLIDDAAKEGAGSRSEATRRPSRAPRLLGVFGASLLAVAVAWVAVRGSLQGPDEQTLEAGRRLAVSIAAEMIRDFARKNGRYPESLSEAMPLGLDLRYRRVEGGFELEATLPDGRTTTVRER